MKRDFQATNGDFLKYGRNVGYIIKHTKFEQKKSYIVFKIVKIIKGKL